VCSSDLGLPPTPENYAEEYYRLTGEPRPQAQLTDEQPTPQETKAFYEEVLKLIRETVQSTLGATETLSRDLSERQGALSSSVETFRNSRDRQEILQLLGTILKQANGIRESVESSRKDLNDNRRELENIQRELIETRVQLNNDPLTGVLNRRALDATLSRDIARAHRAGGSLSVAMIDLDHFKLVNDTYGHQVGDDVLRYFVNMATQAMRQSDALVRYGGDEFIMILPDTELRGAQIVVARIQMLIGKNPFRLEDKAIPLHFSIGLAQLHADEDDKSLISRADKAAYEAKNAGRDCVRVAL
jgi:diguanylate cyclase